MPKVKIDKTKCTLCGTCVEVCPMQVFEKLEKEIKIDDSKCIGCRACEVQCPKQAIKVEDD